MIVLWLLLIASQFSVDYISQQYNYVKLKGQGYQKIEHVQYLSMKILEVTSNVTITEKT